MKHAILAATALALAGCTGLTAPPATVVSTAAPSEPSAAERYFAAATLAYGTAADGASLAVDLGLIRGATATELRAINRQARALIVSGKTASDAARLFALAGRLNTLAGSN